MALVKCKNCNKQISDKAFKCPHCGTEYNNVTEQSVPSTNSQEENLQISKKELEITETSLKPKSNTKKLGFLFCLLGLIIVGLGIFFMINSSPTSKAWDDKWPYYSQGLLDKAKSGDALAQAQVAYCYENARGIEENPEQAFFWAKKSAEQGNAEGLNRLGVCYYAGIGVDVDYAMAKRYFERATVQGNVQAKTNIGSLYFYGDGVEQDYEEAFRWYKEGAEEGNAVGQHQLGICYYNGFGVEQNYEEAVKWLGKAADQKFPEAITGLAGLYLDGDGVAKNEKKALELLKQASELDYPPAKLTLGGCYFWGRGGEINISEAEKLFMEAAKSNDPIILYKIGLNYLENDISDSFKQKGIDYLKKAANLGSEEAKMKLIELGV